MRPLWLPLLLALALTGCSTTRPFVAEMVADWSGATPTSPVRYHLFLVGDAGGADTPHPTLDLLRQRTSETGAESGVVFLGDNIYCCGLPDSASAGRATADRRIGHVLDALDGYEGGIYFIPGNHDWNNGKPGGLDYVRRQEGFLEAYFGRNVFLPDDGFPGPVDVKLTDGVRLVALDTQWWLTNEEKPFGDTGDYELDEPGDLFIELDDILKRRDDDVVIVAGHHPLYSNGVHGGRFPARTHLFPLTALNETAMLPLPLLGSLYPLYTRYFGGPQDLAHPRYRSLRRGLLNTFGEHERLIYAAGHEHSLQYHRRRTPVHGLTQHHIISGSATRPSYVARGHGALFTSSEPGFSELTIHEDGSVWMTMWSADGPGGTELFRTELFGPSRDRVELAVAPETPVPDVADSTVVQAVQPAYAAGPLKSFFLGRHHREAWTTPVEVDVLDLGREAGGLTPVKRGGGQQTISLRLEGADGKEYVLRSLDKDPTKTVPLALQGTVADAIVQDQTASIHPFGAFMIPPLAEAAGVYHTNPRPVYVPHDPRLGIYQDAFAGQIMMLEERPDDDASDQPQFGRSADVISAHKLYREIDGDNDHRVDQEAFVRARLLDMWLSDWDRHQDQWRWASFEPYELDSTLEGEARTQGKVYRPIPRDRDWAFNRMDGLFPSLARYIDPKFQDFTASYGSIKGLTLNGLSQDRRLTNAVPRDVWLSTARSLQAALTDSVIDDAVARLPKGLYDREADDFRTLLRVRREGLDEAAEAFYEALARVVDVIGSRKHERFEVHRRSDEATEVIVYKTTKEGEVRAERYRRTFWTDETEEIRLYGLDGQDTFVVSGLVSDGPRVIVVGGTGEDRFEDTSRVQGLRRKTRFYDTIGGATVEAGPETRVVQSEDPAINAYNRTAGYRHDLLLPQVFFGANEDDGVFIGGGFKRIAHGFRKAPYARSHRLVGNVAARTGAFNVLYEGHFPQRLGAWGLGLTAEVRSPNSFRNFYGLGNATEDTADDATFYEARLSQVRLAPALLRPLDESLLFSLTPHLTVTRVQEDPDRFLVVQAGVAEDTFEDQWFGGVRAALEVDQVDQPHNPRLGFRWTSSGELNVGLHNASATYTRLATDLTIYASPSLAPQVTLALRTGATHLIGDFPFFEASTLGARTNLRGYRSTRFAGRTAFYQNAELRVKVFDYSTYLAIGKTGLLAFLDNGRVWTEADDAVTGDAAGVSQAFLEGYHQGYGGGLWTTIFDLFTLTATYGASVEGSTFSVRFGFQY